MTQIRHLGITVSNLETALRFYQDLLGFKIHKMALESGECLDNFSALKNVSVTTVKMYDKNKNMLELLHYKSHPEKPFNNRARRLSEVGCSHFALTVSDLDSLYKKLTKEGIKFNHPVQVTPDGKVKVAFCRDPDGTFIEMVEEL
jgi:catechol 2,3-dioxygenase-like lactoylglutathione lyase family enzyme